MATDSVTVVRIYVREGEHATAKIMELLLRAKVAGATVIRGSAGFGPDGALHTSSLMSLSLDLPEVVEFYDTPERVNTVLDELRSELSLPHVISWTAELQGSKASR
jgi:PII-like signaling protein